MFDGYYEFHKANVDTPYNKKHLLKTHNYTFRAKPTRYIVQVEEYPEHIFVIKFFRKIDRHNPHKFNVITNEGKCPRIVATCIRILLSILKRHQQQVLAF